MINHWAKEMFLSLNVGIGVVCALARKLALQYANVYQTLDGWNASKFVSIPRSHDSLCMELSRWQNPSKIKQYAKAPYSNGSRGFG